MYALATPEPSPTQMRLRRERRTLTAVLALLLVTTALVSPLAFGSLPLLFLFIVPFALAVLLAVLLGPLSVSPATARADRSQVSALNRKRADAAARHAIATPRRDTLRADDPEALAAAVLAAAEHGVYFGSSHLRDADFLQAFHAMEIPAASFRHGDHLRYTVLLLQRVPAGLASETIAGNLRAFLRHVCGSEALFHATRTHAWVRILQAHLQDAPRATFAELLQRHAPDLHGDALGRFYSNELLATENARRRFVAPDREGLPVLYAPMRSKT